MNDENLDSLSINTMRTLAMDAVEAANSGHPGTPMGMAPVAYALWQHHLRFDPADPIWPNRDRFVLSAGHASLLLYSLLHLTGVVAVDPDYQTLGTPAVSLDDIRKFRQLDSRCPGHPEYRGTSGVETTTWPLGQGVATSVGMAIASQWLGAHYNRPGYELFDYDVYSLAGDGCMMEGISGEAASLAAHLGLSNLCWIYDNNRITIEGLVTFRRTTDRPTLIIVDSHIGYGAPTKQDTQAAHGEPLGAEELARTKEFYGWPEDSKFLVPEGVRAWELFDEQDETYRNGVLPPEVLPRVSVEQASTLGWEHYVGSSGVRIGMHTFGASAPLKDLQKKFGFDPASIVTAAQEQLRLHAATSGAKIPSGGEST